MAIKVFGKVENDPGQYYTASKEAVLDDAGQPTYDGSGNPVELDVQLRVRRMPFEQQLRVEKRYGREEMIPDPVNNFKRPQQVHSGDDNRNIMIDKAEWAWTDCKNLFVEIGDAEGAVVWSKLLGETVVEGSRVALDGKLSNPIKRAIFALDWNIVVFILTKVAEANALHKAIEERKQGN